jgi:N-acetylmuramoyl-L-alanine amidase
VTARRLHPTLAALAASAVALALVGVPAEALPSSSSSSAPASVPAAAAARPGHPLAFTPRWHPRGHAGKDRHWPAGWPRPAVVAPRGSGRLDGVRVLLDPGHNVGNFSHTSLIAASHWPGLRKGCNTTGTATDAGYREAKYAFDVVRVLRKKLRRHGATVIVTRDRDNAASWGPCVAARGELGRQVRADLLVSVHADGGPASGHGFHVIAPARAKGYTDDIAGRSRRLANKVVNGMTARGLARSTYVGSTVQVRGDQETLRNSDVPAVIVETLNMRNRADARTAQSSAGRRHVARGLYAGIVRYAG